MTAGAELEIRACFPVRVLRIPPIRFGGVGLSFQIFNAPLSGKHHFFPVRYADKALLPTMPDDPFDVFEFEGAVGGRLAEISDNGFARALQNSGTNHLVV